mgnify:CR=1 FL=1
MTTNQQNRVSLGEICRRGYVLPPGRYEGMEEQKDDVIPFEEKMVELTVKLYEQFNEA